MVRDGGHFVSISKLTKDRQDLHQLQLHKEGGREGGGGSFVRANLAKIYDYIVCQVVDSAHISAQITTRRRCVDVQ